MGRLGERSSEKGPRSRSGWSRGATSFGGRHVITPAGPSEPLAAIIAQVPHVSGPAAVRATGLRSALRLAPLALRDQVATLLGRDPVYVDAVGLPGTTAVMTSPDAVSGLDAQFAESGLTTGEYPQHVAARIALGIGRYSPIKHADGITCPALVQIAAHDTVTPRGVAEKAAARMARSTVHVYDCGHFDPYVEPYFATTVGHLAPRHPPPGVHLHAVLLRCHDRPVRAGACGPSRGGPVASPTAAAMSATGVDRPASGGPRAR
jgi:uncharacterized protein